jgi:hypothetical protein
VNELAEGSEWVMDVVPKGEEEKKRITAALKGNFLFQNVRAPYYHPGPFRPTRPSWPLHAETCGVG